MAREALKVPRAINPLDRNLANQLARADDLEPVECTEWVARDEELHAKISRIIGRW